MDSTAWHGSAMWSSNANNASRNLLDILKQPAAPSLGQSGNENVQGSSAGVPFFQPDTVYNGHSSSHQSSLIQQATAPHIRQGSLGPSTFSTSNVDVPPTLKALWGSETDTAGDESSRLRQSQTSAHVAFTQSQQLHSSRNAHQGLSQHQAFPSQPGPAFTSQTRECFVSLPAPDSDGSGGQLRSGQVKDPWLTAVPQRAAAAFPSLPSTCLGIHIGGSLWEGGLPPQSLATNGARLTNRTYTAQGEDSGWRNWETIAPQHMQSTSNSAAHLPGLDIWGSLGLSKPATTFDTPPAAPSTAALQGPGPGLTCSLPPGLAYPPGNFSKQGNPSQGLEAPQLWQGGAPQGSIWGVGTTQVGQRLDPGKLWAEGPAFPSVPGTLPSLSGPALDAADVERELLQQLSGLTVSNLSGPNAGSTHEAQSEASASRDHMPGFPNAPPGFSDGPSGSPFNGPPQQGNSHAIDSPQRASRSILVESQSQGLGQEEGVQGQGDAPAIAQVPEERGQGKAPRQQDIDMHCTASRSNAPVAPLAPHTPQLRVDLGKLNSGLITLVNTLLPTAEEEQRRDALFGNLKVITREAYPESTIHLYGSCGNSFGVRGCDIDVCLAIPGPDVSRVEVITRLSTLLRNHGMTNVQALTHARVPIVKFSDPSLETACDMCINNLIAVSNTKLLKDYARIDPRLRQLAFLVKHWAKQRKVNETYRGTLSSYAYVLMCIHFLQLRSPPILPCLQALQPHTYKKVVGDKVCSYHDRIELLKHPGSQNKETVGELLVAFFEYWAFRHDYNRAVISVRTGALLSKEEKEWTRRVGNERHLICIEDPFDLSHDLGRVVDRHSIRVLRDEFHRAAKVLRNDWNPLQVLFEPYAREDGPVSNTPGTTHQPCVHQQAQGLTHVPHQHAGGHHGASHQQQHQNQHNNQQHALHQGQHGHKTHGFR